MNDQNWEQAEQRSGLAITAMVLAIVGFLACPPIGLVGLILGIIALMKANASPTEFGGKAMAIVGIVLGALATVLMFLIVPLMIGILLPALGKARVAAQQLKTQTQARGIAQSMVLYAGDYQDALPPADADWAKLLMDAGFVPPEMLDAPNAPIGVQSFFYVPHPEHTFEADRILLYTNPALDFGSGDGGIICYHDLFCEFVHEPEFSQIVDSILLEDGTPWAPHRE